MARYKQLTLDFDPHQESHTLTTAICSENVGATGGARILRMPTAGERDKQKVIERDAELLARIVRRALCF